MEIKTIDGELARFKDFVFRLKDQPHFGNFSEQNQKRIELLITEINHTEKFADKFTAIYKTKVLQSMWLKLLAILNETFVNDIRK